MNREVIVVLYPFFFPGFRAGGPVQSLVNMIVGLHHRYEFKVITTAYDLNRKDCYPGILLNSWNDIGLTTNVIVQVWYHSSSRMTPSAMNVILTQARPNTIFVNGLFSSFTNSALWLIKKGFLKRMRIVLSPRGMFQDGALKSGSFKKRIYILLLKFLRISSKVIWHVTNEAERLDVLEKADPKARVIVAENIPKSPIERIVLKTKKPGELSLVYLSLITEKKNLLLLLHVLQNTDTKISLDIYGPIKDKLYWQQCMVMMNAMRDDISVAYRGEINPTEVQSTLQKYHALILLTKGENFGHALFESLSVGRPIITSNYTPWQDLEGGLAGWNVDIHNGHAISKKINDIAGMREPDYERYCYGALNLANQYYRTLDFALRYELLFKGA